MSPNEIAEYAIRYCVTRSSYAFTDGLDLANQYWESLSSATRRDVTAACVGRRVDDWRRWPALRADVEEFRSWAAKVDDSPCVEWESYWNGLSPAEMDAERRMMDKHEGARDE